MSHTQYSSPVLERLLGAVNAHDLDALVSCFATDYLNETPVHPRRGFRGNDQVRRNWAQLFAIADLRAAVPRHTLKGDELWTEWEMSGTRPDTGHFLMRAWSSSGSTATRSGPPGSTWSRWRRRAATWTCTPAVSWALRATTPVPGSSDLVDGRTQATAGRKFQSKGAVVILVVGATGQLGGLIVRTLLARGMPVRALTRIGPGDATVPPGAETVVGDLKDPESLARACLGVSAVATTANSVGRAGEDTVESVDRRESEPGRGSCGGRRPALRVHLGPRRLG